MAELNRANPSGGRRKPAVEGPVWMAASPAWSAGVTSVAGSKGVVKLNSDPIVRWKPGGSPNEIKRSGVDTTMEVKE